MKFDLYIFLISEVNTFICISETVAFKGASIASAKVSNTKGDLKLKKLIPCVHTITYILGLSRLTQFFSPRELQRQKILISVKHPFSFIFVLPRTLPVMLLFFSLTITYIQKEIYKKSKITDGYGNIYPWKAASLEIFLLSSQPEELNKLV